MKTFLEGALRLVQEKDIDNVQKVIKHLAEPGNLEHIRQLLEADLQHEATGNTLTFRGHAIPFLNIITNSEFQGSIVVEQYAGTVYNVIYGSQGGTRGVEFFDRLLAHSAILFDLDVQLYKQVFGMILSAFRSTVQLNSNALVQDEIKRIARDALTQAKERDFLADPAMRQLRQDFKVINEQLSLGEQIPSLIPQRSPDGKPASAFHGIMDWMTRQNKTYPQIHPALQATTRLPGDLSELGPRHDNDHASIADIRILPTAEEIRSIESEYLPKLGEGSLNLGRSQQLLDNQFRLLREDSIGGLREALRQIIQNRANFDNLLQSRKGKANGNVKRYSSAGLQVLVHQYAKVEDIRFTAAQGLKITISFNQPISALSPRERSEWWKNTRILDYSTLVCFLNETNEAMFFTVSDRFVTNADIKRGPTEETPSDRYPPVMTLSEDPLRAGIVLSFANAPRQKDIEWLFNLAYSQNYFSNDLIEFPKVMLASFSPILQGLQKRINQTQTIPFIDYLAPDPSIDFQRASSNARKLAVQPPPYATTPGFYFELNSIFSEPATEPLHLYPNEPNFDIQPLLERTSLDDGQARSLVEALSHEVALVQGPPGTGKSFIGTKLVKVLLQSKSKVDLGPIICVCYTNHALDQFLEHLLDNNIKSIVRLGSRSKSDRLEPYILRNLSQAAENTRLEKTEMWQLREETRRCQREAEEYCKTLAGVDSEATIRSHIAENYPNLEMPLFENAEDDEGYYVQRGGPKEKPFTAWKRKSYPGNITRSVRSILNTLVDPWSLDGPERNALLTFWKQEMVQYAIPRLADVIQEHRKETDTLSTVKREWDRRLLQKADIIGVTTTSLAMHADVLERIRAKVLFCEEAGEILEAHTITTLIPSIEHMILIGDHEQLRPHIANYDLSVESMKGQSYALDVSLFERLARQPYGNRALSFPIASLNTQRRMHPSVADLIRLKTYPDLTDKIPAYPEILGMKKRLYWMNHTHPDSKGDALQTTMSYCNEFEQDMVMSLVTHLLHQSGFAEKQIAILTPYLGQMSKLRQMLGDSVDIIIGSRDQEALDEQDLLSDDAEPKTENLGPVGSAVPLRKAKLSALVRIATVDNFQGEEADVVIISLVRSNKERQCGFLKTSNRINVLLSRAKWGMYIIGNADTASSVPMWSNVIDHMTLNDCLGNTLELECERHKDTPIHVASREDFLIQAPEGGCSKRCEWRLTCGHACVAKCHSAPMHELAPCFEPCPKPLQGCNHPCTTRCGEPCAACFEPIENVLLKCGHIAAYVPCWQHQNLDKYTCRVSVEKKVPGCEHKVRVECGRDVTDKNYRCHAECQANLACGHSCSKRCSSCRKKDPDNGYNIVTDHGTCTRKCERPFNTCSHSCVATCHGDSACGFCEHECEVRCAHSRCNKQCKDPCPPCAEACVLGCEHQRCLMPCGVSCTILPCSQLCPKTLECGHPCPSVCGERCPSPKYCRECASDDVLEFVVDMLMFETYRNSRDEPIIFLPCGHFYTVSTFDGTTHMRDFFEFESDADWKITGRHLQEKSDPELPRCPDCRSAFTTSSRYNEIVKKAQLQTCIRRFTASANQQLVTLVQAVDIQQDSLEASRDGFTPTTLKAVQQRYNELNIVNGEAKKYNKQVLEEEQPYHRVYELASFACRRHDISPEDYSPAGSAVQYRFGIEGAYQELRIKLLIACDKDIIAARLGDKGPADKVNIKERMAHSIWASARTAIGGCGKLVDACKARGNRRIEVQVRIARAKFVVLQTKHNSQCAKGKDPMTEAEISEMHKETLADLADCDAICDEIPSCGGLKNSIQDAIKSLNGGVFYSAVSDKEMRELYAAMATEFRGTGHWYTCPNGHQFTIGECGMAMELAKCNECGAQIGGQNHTAVEGVRIDGDLERRMAGLGVRMY
ncbi:hypothetical protein DRE_00222 [Drechslerella stenobrocha 248]|uniref:RZ-type domain-containing protein n=1 Tax=Drechslerella stenobrocha 248 TaxID=1043628 RepID=W7I9X8_9PEZI|nr:hypothetical protein DRE_00222 [Drechslerella stenobrocha 248]